MSVWPRTQPSRAAALRMIVAPFLTAKIISFLVPVLVVWNNSQALGRPSGDELSAAFNAWDSQSYVHLAIHGYPTNVGSDTGYLAAFLPGYPLLVRFGYLLFGNAVVSGLMISFVAEAVALYYIALLVRAEREAAAARFTLWVFALWPFAFFLSAVYTESTFIACAAAALYHARQGDHFRACLAAVLSCAVRVTGVALIPALAWELLARKRLRVSVLDVLALIAIPAPLIAYGAYMRLHANDAFAFFTAQSSPSFNHTFAAPWVGFFATLANVDDTLPATHTYVFGLEVIFGVLGAVLCIALWVRRDYPRSFAIYCTGVLLTATSLSHWLSVPRYELAMFPALIAISDLTRRRLQLRAAIVGVSSALMSFGATLYASGRWLG